MPTKTYIIPDPILDAREISSFDTLTNKYFKLITPGTISKLASGILEVAPKEIKNIGTDIKKAVTEKDLYAQCMKVVVDGFKILEEQTAKYTISRKAVVSHVNSVIPEMDITALSEICFARSYEIAKLVESRKTRNSALAFIEGGATGLFGFAGIPFNLVLSTFLCFRAVQTIAMFYGYDVKDDEAELVIASEVFMKALVPDGDEKDEITRIIENVMAMRNTTEFYLENTEAMLLQMRGAASKSAKKAVEKVGQKTFEETVFKELFEQIGRKLTKGLLKKSIPVASVAVGAYFDVVQMRKLIDYSNIFYGKRFIAEKEKRINFLR